MDLYFQLSEGDQFAIKIGYFDSVMEMKEKIQQYRGIPVSKQVLIFKDLVLRDDLNVHYTQISDGSTIQLRIIEDIDCQIEAEDPIPTPKKMMITLKMATSEQEGDEFSIEVDYFDSVLEIKEKVQKYYGIPVSKQVLIFEDKVLSDDLTLLYTQIFHGSTIQLRIIEDIDSGKQMEEPTPVRKKMMIPLKMPTSEQVFMVEMEGDDSVRHLKQKIHEFEGIPIGRLCLRINDIELDDNHLLRDYDLLGGNLQLEITIRPLPSSSASTSAGNTGKTPKKKLRLKVLTRCGTTITVEVNASDKVEVLKKELTDLQPQLKFSLPSEGYFFIHGQDVMNEDRSFRWHGVKQDDTIDIFGGTVIHGS